MKERHVLFKRVEDKLRPSWIRRYPKPVNTSTRRIFGWWQADEDKTTYQRWGEGKIERQG